MYYACFLLALGEAVA